MKKYFFAEFLSERAALALTNFPFFPDFEETWSVERLPSPVASQYVAVRTQVSFVMSEQLLRPVPESSQRFLTKTLRVNKIALEKFQ